MNTYLLLFIVLYVFGFLFEQYLEYVNNKHRMPSLPKELEGIYDEEKYEKSQKYHQENYNLSLIGSVLSSMVTLILLLSGGFGYIDGIIQGFGWDYKWQVLAFFGFFAIASSIIGLPFSIYSTFKIEEKYGFNTTTPTTFILDKIKGGVIGGILGGLILLLIVWFYQWVGEGFWMYAWLLVSAFSLFMMMFYTSFFVPIFNKLTPLEKGALREKIEQYAQKVNFSIEDIYIMDGSKRSTKANAFFSGMGSQKKIVLYDTLLEKHTHEELVAILAHEVGHYKHKHTIKGLLLSFMQTGMLLFLISLLINNEQLSLALGASAHRFHLNLLAVTFLFGPISLVSSVLMNLFSRKNEYQADTFAKDTYSGDEIIRSLKKLSVDNLSNLTPHPWYVFFHYSHPTLLQRIKNIQS